MSLPHTTTSSNKKEEVQENVGASAGDHRQRSKDGMFAQSVQTALQTLQGGQGDGLLVILHQQCILQSNVQNCKYILLGRLFICVNQT